MSQNIREAVYYLIIEDKSYVSSEHGYYNLTKRQYPNTYIHSVTRCGHLKLFDLACRTQQCDLQLKDIFYSNGHLNFVKKYETSGPTELHGTIIINCVVKGYYSIFEYLLSKYTIALNDVRVLLFQAIENNHHKLTKLLIEHIHISERESIINTLFGPYNAYTCLTLAIGRWNGNMYTIKLLLKLGARIDQDDFLSPITSAMMRSNDILDVLLEHAYKNRINIADVINMNRKSYTRWNDPRVFESLDEYEKRLQHT
jgi:hypothetical protein